MQHQNKMTTQKLRMLKGTCELFEVLDDIRRQIEHERKYGIASYTDAQRELVERIKTTGINKRKPRKGEILLY